jgi:putative membrane protein
MAIPLQDGTNGRKGASMRTRVDRFVSPTDQERIKKLVAAVEQKTSGEVVCMIVPSSDHYPLASVFGATTVALPLALLCTHFIGGWMWIGTQNMWLFIGLFTILFTLGGWLINHVPLLKHPFISRREIDVEVEEAAITAFFRQGLYRTRDANGVLLFLSIFERKVWLLADKGIHAKVPESDWKTLVDRITQGILSGQPVGAICDAIENIGELLQSHYPIKADDTKEIDNLIIEKS